MLLLKFLKNYKWGTIIGVLYVPLSFLIAYLISYHMPSIQFSYFGFILECFFDCPAYKIPLLLLLSLPIMPALILKLYVPDNDNSILLFLIFSTIMAVFLGASIEFLIRKFFHRRKKGKTSK